MDVPRPAPAVRPVAPVGPGAAVSAADPVVGEEATPDAPPAARVVHLPPVAVVAYRDGARPSGGPDGVGATSKSSSRPS
ncbi:MAG TPA: hypothetical protein VG074_01010 [Acidimicrobiales bacterium]|nr:hypothetical protein [Acidimicrobiales bacterium]